MVDKPPAQIDSLLEPLLLSTGDQEAEEILSRLIAEHVEPVIKGVIRYKLHLNAFHPTQRQDVDDIYQETVFQLLNAVRQLRDEPAANSSSDVRGLTAVIYASNVLALDAAPVPGTPRLQEPRLLSSDTPAKLCTLAR